MSRIRIILISIILIHKGKCSDLESFKELVTQEIDTLKKQNTIKDQRITNLENDNEALKTQIALLSDKLDRNIVILNDTISTANEKDDEINTVKSDIKDLKDLSKLSVPESCKDIADAGLTESKAYDLDPDGKGRGNN